MNDEMMNMQDTQQRSPAGDSAPVVSPTRARAGVTGHNVRYVLAISLAAIVVAFAAIYLAYFT
jgi:hypothetical protein